MRTTRVPRPRLRWEGAVITPLTHFQMKTLKDVSTEMALHVLAYNIKRAFWELAD